MDPYEQEIPVVQHSAKQFKKIYLSAEHPIYIVKNISGKRLYHNKHYCYFCGVKNMKMPQHLRLKHRKEVDVEEVK